jgi:DNA-binding transcriptional ArsR family regulator
MSNQLSVATAAADSSERADTSDRIFDALGEPVRRRILELLREGPVAVGVLAGQLPVGRPAVSKHLRLLSGAGLVEHRSVGTKNLYALAPQGLVEAQRWLVATWDTVLSSFADYVAGPAVAGPAVAGPAVAGPGVTGPGVTGPAVTDPGSPTHTPPSGPAASTRKARAR